MKGKTSAKVPSLGKKRRGKGEPLFAEESGSEGATSSQGKKERLVPCFKKKKMPEITKETAQNKEIVVSDSNQEKCTAELKKGGTKEDKRDEDVEHKDRKDILVDDVSILHGVVLPEMQEKEDFDQPKKGDNQGMHKEEMRIEPLQTCQEQSKQSIQEKVPQVKIVISSKDINLQKSMTEHQILCDQNSTKLFEMIGKPPSISENIVLSVSEYSEILPVHQSKTSNPDKHCMDTGLKETTKNTSSTNCTSDAETICFDSINDDTLSIKKKNMYANDEDKTTSAYSKIMMDEMGQYSNNTTGNTLCNVDAVHETIIQAKGHDNACASFDNTMQDTSSGTVDATCHKLIQNSSTDRSLDTDCTCLDKPKIDTEMIFDKDGANFTMNLIDIISSNKKNANLQFSSMYNEDLVCQKKDLIPQCHQFLAESVEPHSLQDSAKKPQIQDTNSIQNGCILLDEVSDEMISYSPIETAEASVSQDPINSYTEGIPVNVAVPKSCRDDCLHNTDFTESQLCEMDWSSQIMEEENTQSVEKPEPRINLSFPQQRIPDGTNIIKGLVKELTNLKYIIQMYPSNFPVKCP